MFSFYPFIQLLKTQIWRVYHELFKLDSLLRNPVPTESWLGFCHIVEKYDHELCLYAAQSGLLLYEGIIFAQTVHENWSQIDSFLSELVDNLWAKYIY